MRKHCFVYLFNAGLMYVIETQKVLDLKINLMASYVIVPQMGFYDPKHNLAILDLGHFQVKCITAGIFQQGIESLQ